MKEVWEILAASETGSESVSFPNTSIAHGFKTSYTYDTLNNLTTVNQGSQTRTFTYSSLSRLVSAANPESGTISYEYDPNGNLTEKTDARGVVTNYVYDQLNRVTDRTYASPSPTPSNYQATPDVEYTYSTTAPSVGKLVKVESTVSTTEYTGFDILGRVTAHKQTTDGQQYTTGYSYNLSGALMEQTYPSGRVVKNTLDVDGSLSQVQSAKSGQTLGNYANGFNYNAAGAVTSMRLGNGLWETTVFNSRLQPTQIGLGQGSASQNRLKLDYSYGDWNGGSVDATKNNGNIVKQVITVPIVGGSAGFTATQKYYYDSLNRLDDAIEEISSTQTWRQDFSYDRYGNRNFVEANTTTLLKNCGASPNFEVCTADIPKVNPVPIAASNKLTGYTYDSSGNTTEDANEWTYIYDAENKQVEVKDDQNASVGQYWYDGDGKRVKKYVPDTGETTVFIYDSPGKQIAEYSTIVQTASNAITAYLTADHLGSPRINTDSVGGLIARHDYHPFGEETATSARTSNLGYITDTIRKKFTGYERDGESGLDYAEARYHNATTGRFNSPDYFRNDTHIEEPASWNLYVYCRNNPLTLIDPNGEKAKVTIETNLDEQTGTVTITASFGIYARKGKFSQKELDKQASLLKKQIEGTFKGKFTKDGVTYSLKAEVAVKTYEDEASAVASGADNVVGLVKASYLSKDSVTGDETIAGTYNLGGDQDHMVIATGSGVSRNNIYAHEFGHALGTNPSHIEPDDPNGNYRVLMGRKAPAATYTTFEDFRLIFGGPISGHVAKHWMVSGRSTPRPAYAIKVGLHNVYKTENIQRSRIQRRTHPY